MSKIRAMALELLATQTSDGNDTVVVTGHDALGDGANWIDVSSFSTLTVDVEPGGSGADFTIMAKRHPGQTAFSFYAKTTSAAAATIVDGAANLGNIIGVSYIQFKELGTNAESQTIIANAE